MRYFATTVTVHYSKLKLKQLPVYIHCITVERLDFDTLLIFN